MNHRSPLIWIVAVALSLSVAAPAETQDAADACPALVERALTLASDSCADLGRNEACYGHNLVTATAWEEAELTAFDAPGDTTDLLQLASLATFPLDVEEAVWGVALLSLQADLPETLPGQAVTFVVFGDAELTSEVPPADQAAAEDDETASLGYTAPMQAFSLRTGFGEPACEEAPRDGLLVQAPQDTVVHFRINGVEVAVGSTALLRVAEGDVLGVNTLDGAVDVTSAGQTQTAAPGQRVDVAPGAPPADPLPYDAADVAAAPVNLLPEPVQIPPPAGTPLELARCAFNQGGQATVSVPDDQALVVTVGWAARTPERIDEFFANSTWTLAYDGQEVALWGRLGPEPWASPLTGEAGVVTWSYWVIPDPASGPHTITLTEQVFATYSDGLDSDGDGQPDRYQSPGVYPCAVTVTR